VLTYTAKSSAAPELAWALLARPDRWAEWAPHLRGAWGLGRPEVKPGARGAARLLGVVPVPARIVEKGVRSWTWRVGPVRMAHRVQPAPGGCVVAIDVSAPAPLERVLALTYGPVIALLVRNLARVAARAR
jgi:hypothetical protein